MPNGNSLATGIGPDKIALLLSQSCPGFPLPHNKLNNSNNNNNNNLPPQDSS